MLVTHDGQGDELRARPMHAHAAREEDAIFFLTDRRDHKDDEIEINDNVCLTFADNSGYRYVSVTGTANVLDDRRKIDELWSTATRRSGR
jgi:general stress protein 26